MEMLVTQYIRPSGRPKVFSVTLPDRFKDKCDLLTSLGCGVVCERLATGQAAQYISHELGDVVNKITSCGTDAELILFDMLDDFNEEMFNEWLAGVKCSQQLQEYQDEGGWPDCGE